MVMSEWLFIALLSVVTGLDRTATTQFQIARPLVCAALAGWVLGIFPVALQFGVMLELLWIMRIPVGATIAPDDTQAAIASVVLFKMFMTGVPTEDLILMVIIGVFVVTFAQVGKCFDVWARHCNEFFFQRCLSLDTLQGWSLTRNHLAGLLLFSVAYLLSFGLIVASGSALLYLASDMLSMFAGSDNRLLPMVFPFVGIAVTLMVLRVKNTVPLFVGGFIMSYGLLLVFGA